jgi:hypothetical protein
VEGQIELQGDSFDFTATKATGIGGLYTLVKSETDLTVTGKSERGNEYSVRYLPDEQTFKVTITLTSGQQHPVNDPVKPRSPAEERAYRQQSKFRDYRLILLDSGIGKGNKTFRSPTVSGRSSGFSVNISECE